MCVVRSRKEGHAFAVTATLLFLASIIGPWVWFDASRFGLSVVAEASKTGCWLTATNQLPGYAFLEEVVGLEVKRILKTDDVRSGTFVKDVGNKANNEKGLEGAVHVLLISWDERKQAGLNEILHTPDNCWPSAGWEPVNLTYRRYANVELPLRSVSENAIHAVSAELSRPLPVCELPIDCRVFQPKHGGALQLTVWCRMINGQPFSDPTESANPRVSEINRTATFLHRTVQSRLSLRESKKQLVRLSTTIHSDFESTLELLRTLAALWLKPEQVEIQVGRQLD